MEKNVVNQNKLLVECFDQPKIKAICNYKWFLFNHINCVVLFLGESWSI